MCSEPATSRGKIGEWAGTRGSRQWIEGFSLTPRDGIKPPDLEYQAVLGRGWLSPWIEGGKFCGSRGMALPLLGLKVRLKGGAAKTHECSYSATFRRRQCGRTGAGRRDLRGREPGRAGGVSGGDPPPRAAAGCGTRRARATQRASRRTGDAAALALTTAGHPQARPDRRQLAESR